MGKSKHLTLQQQTTIAKMLKKGVTWDEITEITGFSRGAINTAYKKFENEIKLNKTKDEEQSKKEIYNFVPKDRALAIKVFRTTMEQTKDNRLRFLAAKETIDRTVKTGMTETSHSREEIKEAFSQLLGDLDD